MAILNTARLFQELLASKPILTGTVNTHNADGTSTVSMTGGGIIRAIGQSVPVSGIAQIQDGVVIGQAASLPVFNLTV